MPSFFRLIKRILAWNNLVRKYARPLASSVPNVTMYKADDDTSRLAIVTGRWATELLIHATEKVEETSVPLLEMGPLAQDDVFTARLRVMVMLQQ